jgi:activator of HSP90 ATPase
MAKTIIHEIVFKNAAPKDLYDLYMNAKKHSIATGAPAKITAKEGAAFSTHDGYISGKNLRLVKNKLIVQTWRAVSWDKTDSDSIFSIFLEPKGKNTVLYAIHANIPDKHEAGIDKGWYQHYWEPWKKYLAGKPIAKSIEM